MNEEIVLSELMAANTATNLLVINGLQKLVLSSQILTAQEKTDFINAIKETDELVRCFEKDARALLKEMK